MIFEKISVRLLVAHLLVVFIKENIENSESFSYVNFDAEMQIFAGIKTGNDVWSQSCILSYLPYCYRDE